MVVPLLWMLSPLGGQSSLRVLSRTETNIESSTTVTYYNDTYWSGNAYDSSSTISNSHQPESIYAACLLQSDVTRNSSLDNWGNVKIPVLGSLEAHSPNKPTDQWTEVSPARDTTYSSLVGTMLDLPTQANETTMRFSIEATYLELDCSRKFSTTSYSELIHNLGPVYVGFNTSKPSSNSTETPLFFLGEGEYHHMGFNNFLLGVSIQELDVSITAHKKVLKYAAKTYGEHPSQLTFFTYECAMKMPRVEAEVYCEGHLPCYVGRMRTSQRVNVSIDTTPFNDQQAAGIIVGGTALPNLLGHLLWASGTVRVFQRTASEWYILTGQPRLQGNGDGHEYATLADEQLSSRLSVLLTTLWKIAVAGSSIYNQTAAAASCDFGNNYSCRESGYWPARAEASMIQKVQVWRAHREWIGITMVLSIITLGFGIFGLLLKRNVHVPDILGYVSTMTRDNPYFDGPGGGEHLNGAERANMLKSTYLKLMDVNRTGSGTGHIALASYGGDGQYEAVTPSEIAQIDDGDGSVTYRESSRVSDRSSNTWSNSELEGEGVEPGENYIKESSSLA